jgi:anti-anti-sigma regulatory factor
MDQIDSAGLGELDRTYRMVARAGGTLKLVKLNQRFTKIFKWPWSD